MFAVTVRQRIDQLISEPAVGDLGYTADQRSVASIVLGLKLLAESIDAIEDRLAVLGRPEEIEGTAGLTAEIHDLTTQVRRLAKIMRKVAKKK